MNPAALILCGGMSRRMGRPKALLPFGDEVLLQRVVRLLTPVARPIVVVASPDQPLPALPPEVRLARDPLPGRGPLQGLATGLNALPDTTDLVFATAVDVPFLRPAWVARLMEHVPDADLVIPEIGGYRHPLAALYRRSAVLPTIDRLLDAGQLRLLSVVHSVRTVVLDESHFRDLDPDMATLWNLNTPEDYAHALAQEGLSPQRET